MPSRSSGKQGAQVCRAKGRDSDSAVSASGSLAKGGGGVGPRESLSYLPDLSDDIAARLIAPRPDEKLALTAIRHRASNGTSCTTTAQLAVDLRTTRERARHLLSQLHRKGWVVTNRHQAHWLPTSMAGLAYRMLDVEKLVRGLAESHGNSGQARLRELLALARDIWMSTGPAAGHVPHPTADPHRQWVSRDESARRAGLIKWADIRRRSRAGWAADAAHRELQRLQAVA